MKTAECLTGVILWALLWYPVWSPRCARVRQAQRNVAASRGSGSRKSVSRNRQHSTNSPAWEQDAPYPECFEEGDL